MPSQSGVFADCAACGGGGEGGGGGLSLFSLLKPTNNATSSACSALRRIGGLGFWVSGWARHLFPAGRALLRGRKPFAAAFRQSEGTVSSPRPRRNFPSIQIAHTCFGARDIPIAVRHKPWLVRGHVPARARYRTGGRVSRTAPAHKPVRSRHCEGAGATTEIGMVRIMVPNTSRAAHSAGMPSGCEAVSRLDARVAEAETSPCDAHLVRRMLTPLAGGAMAPTSSPLAGGC